MIAGVCVRFTEVAPAESELFPKEFGQREAETAVIAIRRVDLTRDNSLVNDNPQLGPLTTSLLCR